MSFSAATFSVPTTEWCLRLLSTKHLLDRHLPVMHDLRQSSLFKPRAVASLSLHPMLFAFRREERVQNGDVALSWSRSTRISGG